MPLDVSLSLMWQVNSSCNESMNQLLMPARPHKDCAQDYCLFVAPSALLKLQQCRLSTQVSIALGKKGKYLKSQAIANTTSLQCQDEFKAVSSPLLRAVKSCATWLPTSQDSHMHKICSGQFWCFSAKFAPSKMVTPRIWAIGAAGAKLLSALQKGVETIQILLQVHGVLLCSSQYSEQAC